MAQRLHYSESSIQPSVPDMVKSDLNSDSSVDAADAAIMFANWGSSNLGDVNADGIIDAADAGVMFAEWTGDPAVQAVPEPACWCLASLAVGLLFTRNSTRFR